MLSGQIETALQVLRAYLRSKVTGTSPPIDRAEVIAHAFLSGLAHHWPSKADRELLELLEATQEIKDVEHGRWAVQRRISIAKLCREFRVSSPLLP